MVSKVIAVCSVVLNAFIMAGLFFATVPQTSPDVLTWGGLALMQIVFLSAIVGYHEGEKAGRP